MLPGSSEIKKCRAHKEMLAARHRPNKENFQNGATETPTSKSRRRLPAILISDHVTALAFNGPVDWKLLVTRRPVGNQLIRPLRNGPIKTAAQGSSRFASQLKRRPTQSANKLVATIPLNR